ncbi:MAG: acetyl-CoA synthase, partial [Desulfobacteraceae bacterium]
KAEAEAKAKADAAARETEDLRALRYKRAQEREQHVAQMQAKGAQVKKTPAEEQIDMVDKLIRNIDRIHRRI